jgi:hypothetical protein
MFLIALRILFHTLWSQLKKDSGTAWIEAAVDCREASRAEVWKEEGRQGSDVRMVPIETVVDN